MASNQPAKISVIMPNYNNGKFIAQAIDSVLQQDYPNIELIVIDDGSTDNSMEVISSYGGRISILRQQNKGAAAARNHGMRFAQGKFISFIDSDDIWLQGKLSSQIDFLNKNTEFIACFCSWRAWNGSDNYDFLTKNAPTNYEVQQDHTGWLYLKLLKSSIISTITILIRKDIVELVGFFDEKLTSGEDHDYWIRLSRVGKIAKISNLFALYRTNPSSITNSVQCKNFSLVVLKNNVERFGLCNLDGKCLDYSDYKKYIADRNFVYGYQCFWNDHRSKAKSSFIQSIKCPQYFIKSLAYILICQTNFIYSRVTKKFKK